MLDMGVCPKHSLSCLSMLFALPGTPFLSPVLTGRSPLLLQIPYLLQYSLNQAGKVVLPFCSESTSYWHWYYHILLGSLSHWLVSGWFKAKNCTSQILVSLQPNPGLSHCWVPVPLFLFPLSGCLQFPFSLSKLAHFSEPTSSRKPSPTNVA